MNFNFDPLSSFAVILMQIGNRYLKLNITKAQEKILQSNVTQLILYFCIIFFYTKSIPVAIIMVSVSYTLMFILLNENHKYNILPKQWLYKEKLINEPTIHYVNTYKENMKDYHS